MEKLKEQCVAILRRQTRKTGLNIAQFSDDEIWAMWWKAVLLHGKKE